MRNALSNVIQRLTILETEKRVLGELIYIGDPNNEEIHECMNILTKDCFAFNDSNYLFCIIKNQYDNNLDFSTYTLIDLLPKDQSSAFSLLQEVTSIQKSSASIIYDCNKLKIELNNRNAIKSLIPMFDRILSESDPFVVNETINNAIAMMCNQYQANNIKPKTILEITDLYFQGHYDGIKKTPTGIETLDHHLRLDGGFNNGSLVTIAGESGHGKTHFALYLSLNIGLHQPNKQILFFNLEMNELDIMRRYFTLKNKKNYDLMSKDEQMIAYLDKNHADINVYPPKAKDIKQIMTFSRYEHSKKPVALIVIDYIGLLELSDNQEQHYLRHVMINSRLAELAIELNCIVIATTQINRNSSRRADKRPLIADAADSMGGQRSSSYWFGIYRPEIEDKNTNMKNIFNLRCLKSREGLLFDVNFLWNNSCLAECDHQTGYHLEKESPIKWDC